METRKGDLSVVAYFSTMRGYADEMDVARNSLDNDDVVSYILNGLDADYNSLVEHVNGMTNSISPETLYSCMLDTEAQLATQKAHHEYKEQYQLVANVAARSGGGGSGNKQQN
jgi:predicted component of type VI protein secretion system